MRSYYYKFIGEKNILNILQGINELSYSFKTKILEELYNKYGTEIVNNALYNYKKDYMDAGRIDLKKLKNVLKFYCKQYQEKNASTDK